MKRLFNKIPFLSILLAVFFSHTVLAVITPSVSQSELSVATDHLLLGKEKFVALQLNEPIQKLNASQTLFYKHLSALTDGDSLYDTHLYLALCYFTQNELPKAKAELQKAYILNFKKELASKDFPTKFLQFFKETKNELSKTVSKSRLEIHSQPPFAKIYINGFEMGLTPLHLETWPIGKHTVRIVHESHETWTQTIELTKNNHQIQAQLKEQAPIQSISKKLQGQISPLEWLQKMESQEQEKAQTQKSFLSWAWPVLPIVFGIVTYQFIQNKKDTPQASSPSVIQANLP